MASNTLTLTMTIRWWVWPYVHALTLFCRITGFEPDIGKVSEFIVKRGMKIKAGK